MQPKRSSMQKERQMPGDGGLHRARGKIPELLKLKAPETDINTRILILVEYGMLEYNISYTLVLRPKCRVPRVSIILGIIIMVLGEYLASGYWDP